MQKKKGLKKLDKTVMWMSLFCFLAVISISLLRQYSEYQILKEQELQVLAELNREKQKKLSFEKERQMYSSDQYIEKVAREQLGLIQSNEVLYIRRDATE